MHIINALKSFSKSKIDFFTTPGHSLGKFIPKEVEDLTGKKCFKADFSEIDGLDNLQKPEDILLKSQQILSDLYGSRQSFYLTNGSSSGILALMLATAQEGDKVLIARNAHKSVINALVLTGAIPIWLDVNWHNFWNIPTTPNIENIKNFLDLHPDIKSVWITNPTYEGVSTDISIISSYIKDKGIPLIVDEAHGALWNMSPELPTTAILDGADASVQSIHKTAGSLNQSAVLHLSKNSLIPASKIQQALNTINTTSPSYLLLASLEGSINYLHSIKGKRHLDRLLGEIDKFKDSLSKNLDIQFLRETEDYKIDKTKLLISISGINGFDLARELYKNCKIETEFDNYKSILAVTGIGTDKPKLKRLENALLKAKKTLQGVSHQTDKTTPLIMPKLSMTPRQAFFVKGEKVSISESVGRVSKEIVVSYPPAIPTLTPGEIIQEGHLALFKDREFIEVVD